MATKAAALVQSMAGNHGFADGNKRTTLILLFTLLQRSGYGLRPIPGDKDLEFAAEAMILDVVNHVLSLAQLIAWFKARLVRL
jgi:death on curing protein